MPKKAETKPVQKTVQNTPKEFTKEQLLTAEKYQNRRDLVDALLKQGKKYTIGTVDKKINEFMKGKVK